MIEPVTSPQVAAAMAAGRAPAAPACSISGPKAAEVPRPPVSDTEPAASPISGCTPSAAASPTPTTFCSSTSTSPTAAPRNRATPTPPFFSISKLAEKPMVVKNASRRKSRMPASLWNAKAPLWWPASASNENSSPPMIGPGMK